MKVAMAGQTWGAVNGPGVFARRLAQRLAQRGHEIMSIIPATGLKFLRSSDDAVVLAQIPAISVAPFYPEVRITPVPLRKVASVLEQFQPDLVHIQDHYLLSRATLDAACRLGRPVLATNHFLPANILPHVPLSARAPSVARWAERFLWKTLIEVLRRTNAVTTPTRTAAAILESHLKQVPIRSISCGVDTEHWRPPTAAMRSAARLNWGIGPTDMTFAYVGRLDCEKRVDLLLAAMARLRRGNIRLFVAGRGHEAANLQALACKYRLGQRARFVGFLEEGELISLLHASDFFVMASEAELQSIATLEAMAVGLPVLGADACALPELVERGVNGELFEPGAAAAAAEKMEFLAARPERWPEMSRASRARAGRHSLGLTAERYEALYRALILNGCRVESASEQPSAEAPP